MKVLPCLFSFAVLSVVCPLASRAMEPAPQDINSALGAELFADDSLWDDDASVAAGRLKWPQESATKDQASFRLYPSVDAKFAGAHPYSLALYAAGGKPDRVSIVFANKGDFGNYFRIASGLAVARGSERSALQRQAKEVLQDFPKALDADAKAVADALTRIVGPSEAARLSLDGVSNDKVSRWNWKGHAFLLAERSGGFVGLQIVPAASLDEKIGIVRQRDADLKTKLRSQLQQRINGDVVIGELPMVNQGPKGFCVPATMERCFRYLGIPADMYVLALKAQTGMGGGTGAEDIFAAASGLARAYGRRFEKIPANLRINSIAKSIDDGLPILWGMNARDDLERDITDRSVQRQTMTDPIAWKKLLKNVKRPKPHRGDELSSGHMCLIIGYNKTTDEIAISDSWGPEFAERWMTEDELAAMNEGYAAVIGF
ncbi:MAG TPA: C39 family peptidase [Chthoniobacterales bacterium]